MSLLFEMQLLPKTISPQNLCLKCNIRLFLPNHGARSLHAKRAVSRATTGPNSISGAGTRSRVVESSKRGRDHGRLQPTELRGRSYCAKDFQDAFRIQVEYFQAQLWLAAAGFTGKVF